jgi:hypothetical protein
MLFDRSLRRCLFLGLCVCAVQAPAVEILLAQDPPTTRPDRPGQGRRDARGPQQPQVGQMLEQIREAARATALSAEQEEKVNTLISAAEVDLRELMPRLQDLPPDERRRELQTIVAGLIEEVHSVLTTEQRPAYRQAIEAFREGVQRRGGEQPATRPATQPGGRPGEGPGARVGQQLERLSEALGQLELTPEQDEKVQGLLTSLRQDIRRLAQEHAGDRQAMAQAVGARMQEFRPELEAILTPEQLERMAAMMQRRPGDQPATQPATRPGQRPATRPGQRQGNSGGDRPGGGGRPGEGGQGGPEAMQPMDGMQGPDRRPAGVNEIDREAFLDRITASQGMAVGQSLDDALQVVSLTAKERPLRQFVPNMEALVVLVGSASSPAFRDRLADLENLRHQTLREADLLIIYTREQHAAGEWTVQRNKLDGVEIPQHEDLEARIAAARKMRTTHDLKVEIVVDTMDDAALKALVGDSPHCAALVFAPGGTLVGKQQWFDPTGIPALVEQAMKRN